MKSFRQNVSIFTVLALTVFGMLFLVGCSKDNAPGGPGDGTVAQTPRTSVPAELVGTWYNGSVSSINFYNQGNGSWTNAGGTGLFYTLNADGTFEYGWQISSTLYGCTSRALVYKRGTVAVDSAAIRFTAYSTYARIHSEDNCSASGNYDRAIPTDSEVIQWQFSVDEVGNRVLLLSHPDGTPSSFYPMQ